MNMFLRIKKFLDELDERKRLYYLLGAAVGIFLFFGLLFYWQRTKCNRVIAEIKKVNAQRQRARGLLERNAIVDQRKREVSDLLAQKTAFKIKEFFLDTVRELGFYDNMTLADVSTPQDLQDGYSETTLVANFSGISMQQLVELDYRIEKNGRLYTKEMSITKSPQKTALDVTLSVAALEPQPGA